MALKKVYSLSWTQDHCSDMAWIYKSFQVGNKTKYQRFLKQKNPPKWFVFVNKNN